LLLLLLLLSSLLLLLLLEGPGTRSTNRRGVLVFCNKVKTLNFLLDFLAKQVDAAPPPRQLPPVVPPIIITQGVTPPSGRHRSNMDSISSAAASAIGPCSAPVISNRPPPRQRTSVVVGLHGKMTQEARDEALRDFRSGKKSILIATGEWASESVSQ
jgi:hypothetical protein